MWTSGVSGLEALTGNIGVVHQQNTALGVLEAVFSLPPLFHGQPALREFEQRIDRPRDQLLRIGITDARLLTTDPVFHLAGTDVLANASAPVPPGVVTNHQVDTGLPELCSEP